MSNASYGTDEWFATVASAIDTLSDERSGAYSDAGLDGPITELEYWNAILFFKWLQGFDLVTESDLRRSMPNIMEGVSVRKVKWSGNRNVPGCPIIHGWIVRLTGPVADEEREWFSLHGFHHMSGRKWGRSNRSEMEEP